MGVLPHLSNDVIFFFKPKIQFLFVVQWPGNSNLRRRETLNLRQESWVVWPIRLVPIFIAKKIFQIFRFAMPSKKKCGSTKIIVSRWITKDGPLTFTVLIPLISTFASLSCANTLFSPYSALLVLEMLLLYFGWQDFALQLLRVFCDRFCECSLSCFASHIFSCSLLPILRFFCSASASYN